MLESVPLVKAFKVFVLQHFVRRVSAVLIWPGRILKIDVRVKPFFRNSFTHSSPVVLAEPIPLPPLLITRSISVHGVAASVGWKRR